MTNQSTSSDRTDDETITPLQKVRDRYRKEAIAGKRRDAERAAQIIREQRENEANEARVPALAQEYMSILRDLYDILCEVDRPEYEYAHIIKVVDPSVVSEPTTKPTETPEPTWLKRLTSRVTMSRNTPATPPPRREHRSTPTIEIAAWRAGMTSCDSTVLVHMNLDVTTGQLYGNTDGTPLSSQCQRPLEAKDLYPLGYVQIQQLIREAQGKLAANQALSRSRRQLANMTEIQEAIASFEARQKGDEVSKK